MASGSAGETSTRCCMMLVCSLHSPHGHLAGTMQTWHYAAQTHCDLLHGVHVQDLLPTKQQEVGRRPGASAAHLLTRREQGSLAPFEHLYVDFCA